VQRAEAARCAKIMMIRDNKRQKRDLTNSSINVDVETCTISASLPFITDPHQRLANNKDREIKVYQQQLWKLNQPANSQDLKDIIESEQKLQ